MTEKTSPARYGYSKPPSRRWPKVLGGVILILAVLALTTAVIVVVVRPAPVISFLEGMNISVPRIVPEAERGSASASTRSERDSGKDAFGRLDDKPYTQEDATQQAEHALRIQKTPIIARCDGVELRSLISMADLTGILFHQASYNYALELETELPEAHYETIADKRTFGINHDQVTTEGAWAETEALHLWRTSDATAPDTSIDVGSYPGTPVKSPVDGTVVLVKEYMLYEETPDVEIHIEPTGRHDLDCVIIHVTDPRVKPGDKVVAGQTDIAYLRDIESVLTDVQLGFFTPEGVGGNHAHVQMNNAETPEYREKKLEGAIVPA